MLSDFTGADKVYIACGYTDLRRGIDGLAALVQQEFPLDPFTNTLFLFCGRRRDRIKALYWEGNGFLLLYKRLRIYHQFKRCRYKNLPFLQKKNKMGNNSNKGLCITSLIHFH